MSLQLSQVYLGLRSVVVAVAEWLAEAQGANPNSIELQIIEN